ncbi:hypothetical protein H6G89_05640 [Oscillatoria sp. FACHB-1407]|uniref:hypothetical protein n=1 Tax=Oscillatoria sp. FACHB-1407 TaxID=2692847 RepID=UPI001687407D|nr:hypothetical protein [Oscillatoria sp. FACHB-1407]MBD2460523.1 hypothetical protein [Oscillatoria sp. FACHB-1407]
MIRIVLVVMLATLLTACGFGNIPQSLVEQAIALQLTQTQQELGQLLYTDAPQAPSSKINHIKVNHRDSLMIQGLAAYHLQGTYDVTLDFPDHHVTQRENPFEIYLQQTGDKTWSLARPKRETEGEDWAITALDPQT